MSQFLAPRFVVVWTVERRAFGPGYSLPVTVTRRSPPFNLIESAREFERIIKAGDSPTSISIVEE